MQHNAATLSSTLRQGRDLHRLSLAELDKRLGAASLTVSDKIKFKTALAEHGLLRR